MGEHAKLGQVIPNPDSIDDMQQAELFGRSNPATALEALATDDAEPGDPARSPLLPERRPEGDLFVCDIFDAVPKADMAAMEHPIFSLSTKPDKRMRRYENGGLYVEIRPSLDGLATVHDRDILIYCISQLMAGLNADPARPVSRDVRLKAHDLLVATNRATNGQGYEALKAALRRLQGTQIETNIKTGGHEVIDIFSLIDRARIVRETREGRMREVEIELSDWVVNAIRAREVLTLNRDYFRLRKPLERRMYEIARKHCGRQREWRIALGLLQRKCGSCSTLKEFRRLVGAIAEQDAQHGHFPDYRVQLTGDIVTFASRAMARLALPVPQSPPLKPDTIEHAKGLLPRHDIYHVVETWRQWSAGKAAPANPDGAFIAFCKVYAVNNPL